MITIYGSLLCPDCMACKEHFDVHQIEYEFIDINESLEDLKTFIRMRDQDAIFEYVRSNGLLGIPALINEEGQVFLDWENYLTALGYEVRYPEDQDTEEIELPEEKEEN